MNKNKYFYWFMINWYIYFKYAYAYVIIIIESWGNCIASTDDVFATCTFQIPEMNYINNMGHFHSTENGFDGGRWNQNDQSQCSFYWAIEKVFLIITIINSWVLPTHDMNVDFLDLGNVIIAFHWYRCLMIYSTLHKNESNWKVLIEILLFGIWLLWVCQFSSVWSKSLGVYCSIHPVNEQLHSFEALQLICNYYIFHNDDKLFTVTLFFWNKYHLKRYSDWSIIFIKSMTYLFATL